MPGLMKGQKSRYVFNNTQIVLWQIADGLQLEKKNFDAEKHKDGQNWF